MKNKFLSKKWLVWLMAVMLIVLSITGCSGKDDDDDDDDRKSRREESVDDEDDDDDNKKDKDDEAEPTPEPTVEATPEPTAEPTPEPTEEPVEVDPTDAAYMEYFDNYNTALEENVIVTISESIDGIYTEMTYGYSGDNAVLYVLMGDSEMEMYTDADYIYLYGAIGEESGFYKAVNDGSSDATSMASEVENFIDDIEYVSYLQEYKMGSTPYDIVICNVESDSEVYEAYCYVNKETQQVEYMDLEDEAGNLIQLTYEYYEENDFNFIIEDGISYFDDAEEVSGDDLAMVVLAVVMSGSMPEDSGDIDVSYEDNGGNTETDDWSTAYDDYFADGLTIPETFEITTQVDLGGIILDYIVAQNKGVSLVRYRIGDYGVDAYADEYTIVMENIGLNGSEWVRAEFESSEDMADILGADFTELVGGMTDSVSSVTYIEEVEEDGVVYDVMEVDAEGTPSLVYVNRETQTVNRLVIESEGMELVCMFEGFEPFEIPAEAADATEMTKDELANYYQEAIIGSVYASMGMEY